MALQMEHCMKHLCVLVSLFNEDDTVSPPCLSLLQSPLEYITIAAISKIFAVAVTYPYQVVRARLQDQHNNYSGIVDVMRRAWR